MQGTVAPGEKEAAMLIVALEIPTGPSPARVRGPPVGAGQGLCRLSDPWVYPGGLQKCCVCVRRWFLSCCLPGPEPVGRGWPRHLPVLSRDLALRMWVVTPIAGCSSGFIWLGDLVAFCPGAYVCGLRTGAVVHLCP